MKISIAYPPLESRKGIPLLGQNRQFQWFSKPTYIYPVVPASAATMLLENGHDVSWDDYIAEGKTLEEFYRNYKRTRPDAVVIETKTPVISRHYAIVDRMKEMLPETKIIMVGDHVTACSQEVMEHCRVDFILTGGDYDFLLADLCDNLEKNDGSINVGELESGIWYRDNGEIKNTGGFCQNHDLDGLPMIDRDLTKWWLYSEKNGNYSRTPGTYIMSARDCWHHRCTFCSWTTLYPQYARRSPEKVLDEIGMLVEKYGVKEIMDDSGAFPTGKWLHRFCRGMVERGYHKKVILDCNMRFCALSYKEYRMMKRAGFRFVLFGLESANQETLDRIDKAEKVGDMVESCRMAKKAGLSPHITIMFGYPWEGEEEIRNTVRLGRMLLKKGWAHTLQATVLIPYPGTPLYQECKENGWLATENYDDFDQRMPVMKTPVGEKRIHEAVQSVYKVAFHPEFLARRILGIRSLDDIRFFARAGKQVVGHLMDFGE